MIRQPIIAAPTKIRVLSLGNRRVYFLVAILLHLLVLYGFLFLATRPPPPVNEKHYVEVSLAADSSTNAGPAEPPGNPTPGPRVDDLPPPVAEIAPEFTPPAPVPETPVAETPPPPPAPVLPTPLPSAPPAGSGVAQSPSRGPVSGIGGGGAKRWSDGGGGNGHYYEAIYTPEGINWLDAQKYALAHGGYLATISSPGENTFVFNLVKDPKFWRFTVPGQYSGPWFGACNQNDVWQRVNNEGPIGYNDWYPTEPEERPTAKFLYGLHFYTEGFSAAANGQTPGGRAQGPPPRGMGFGPRGMSIAQPGPTWDVSQGSVLLLGFVVEYNTDPARIRPNPAAAEKYVPPVPLPAQGRGRRG